MKVKKILISQPKPASDKSPYFDIEQKFGAEVVFRPFIVTEGVSAKDFRAQKINIADYSAIIFNSKIAVDNFFSLCDEMRLTMPATQKYFCTSEVIANYLQKYIVYRKRKVFVGKTAKIADLIPTMLKHKTESYLMPVSDINNGEEVALIASHNLKVQSAVMYRTVPNTFGPDEAFDYDMLVFFSPQGIESLFTSFPDFKQGDIAIATFGNSTTKSAEAAGLRVDVPAPTPENPSMAAAIGAFLAKK